jgi:radical SAM superfamily enzyme YgiQ (UPF0313 family)
MRPGPPDLLLVNPWIYDFTAYDFWLKPLGLLCIAAIVRSNSSARFHFLDCLDRFHPGLATPQKSKPDGRGPYPKEEVPKPEALKDIPRKYSRYGIPPELFEDELSRLPVPDAVLITCAMTYWYPGVQLAVELVRKRFGSVPIILGGVYATLAAEHARRHSGADIVISGPAENEIVPALRNILGDSVIGEAQYPTFGDLPKPAMDLLRDKSWLPILTSRGCPYRCAFCAGPLLFAGFEQRDPTSAAAEIEEAFIQYGTRNFAFYDDALLLNKRNHAIPILEEIARKKLPLSFHTPNGLHVREIDQELAQLFKKAGVSSIYLSQETFDERVIGESCPKVEPGDFEKALVCLENAGYPREQINVYLIAGLPGQSLASIVASVRHVRSRGAKPRLAFFSPIPGTPIWDELVRAGKMRVDADPLLHNKMTFPYLWGDFSAADFAALRGVLDGR